MSSAYLGFTLLLDTTSLSLPCLGSCQPLFLLLVFWPCLLSPLLVGPSDMNVRSSMTVLLALKHSLFCFVCLLVVFSVFFLSVTQIVSFYYSLLSLLILSSDSSSLLLNTSAELFIQLLSCSFLKFPFGSLCVFYFFVETFSSAETFCSFVSSMFVFVRLSVFHHGCFKVFVR